MSNGVVAYISEFFIDILYRTHMVQVERIQFLFHKDMITPKIRQKSSQISLTEGICMQS